MIPRFSAIILVTLYAGVAELADASDLKSEALTRGVWVRFPPPAPLPLGTANAWQKIELTT